MAVVLTLVSVAAVAAFVLWATNSDWFAVAAADAKRDAAEKRSAQETAAASRPTTSASDAPTERVLAPHN